MDPANLNLDGLTLSDEGLTLNLASEPETAAILKHCLIGRVLADREIQFAYFSERMSRAWKPGKRVKITKSVADCYLFQFHHEVDVARVLDEGPWLYDNFHIVVDRIAPGAVANFVPLNHIDFWVQVHGLPFGFNQPKVGQGIGSFLGTLKSFDDRNSIHSSYMSIKVAIDVTVPLKKEWRVRAVNGEFVTINFKYEKLSVFCHMCGVLGHTDKTCPELFELEADDGVRNWGVFLKPTAQRIGTAATNRWLQDPIPATMPRNNHPSAHVPADRTNSSGGTVPVPNFNERMLAMQSQISAIKHDMLAVQTASQAKHAVGASALCHFQFLASSSSAASASNLIMGRQLVLGLPAAPGPSTINEGTLDETGSELKKRKRMLALQHGDCLADGEMGNDVIGAYVSQGGDDEMLVTVNPLFDVETDMAGSDDQACLGK